MPYIKSTDDRREKLRKGEPALNAGELNYQIFYYMKHTWQYSGINIDYANIIIDFIEQFLGDKPNYQRWNDVSGVMIRCAKEIKRRLDIDLEKEFIFILEKYDEEIGIYEDKKIIENKDVE